MELGLFPPTWTADVNDVHWFLLNLLSLAVIASNFQTCLGLLMHYPPLGDIHSLLQKALFLRDPKVRHTHKRINTLVLTCVKWVRESVSESRSGSPARSLARPQVKEHARLQTPAASSTSSGGGDMEVPDSSVLTQILLLFVVCCCRPPASRTPTHNSSTLCRPVFPSLEQSQTCKLPIPAEPGLLQDQGRWPDEDPVRSYNTHTHTRTQ